MMIEKLKSVVRIGLSLGFFEIRPPLTFEIPIYFDSFLEDDSTMLAFPDDTLGEIVNDLLLMNIFLI
jgi:hypothetical protein